MPPCNRNHNRDIYVALFKNSLLTVLYKKFFKMGKSSFTLNAAVVIDVMSNAAKRHPIPWGRHAESSVNQVTPCAWHTLISVHWSAAS